MNLRLRRPLAVVASSLFLGLVLTTSTGCGALSAMGNPKVAWALQDPAPMTVVVRRADVADATVQQVNRLLTATPTGGASDWLAKLTPDADAASEALKQIGAEPLYAESHARVVNAEVWAKTLPRIKSARGEHPSLLAAINPDLAAAYADIIGKKAELAALVALIDEEKTALDAKNIDPDDKITHQVKLHKLEKMKSASEAEVAPLQTAFLAAAGDAASQLSADQKAKLAPAVAALLQALGDADVANSAAAIRFPLALPSMLSSVKGAVPTIVADIVEEKTGKRPSLTKLDAQVTLNGTDVSVTLDGLGPSELGALKMDDLTRETIARTARWVVRATSLLSAVSATKDAIAFQTDALSKLQSGLGGGAGSTDATGAPGVMVAVQAPSVDVGAGMVGGLAGGVAGKKLGVPKLPDAKLAVGAKVGGLGGLSGVPGAGALTAAVKAPSLPGVPGVAASAGGLPGLGGVKLPGAAGSAFSMANSAMAMAKDPKGAALDLAKDAAGAAAKKIPGGGAALALAGNAAAIAKDPKGAAADLAKEGAAAALKKVPIPGGLKVGFGFGK